MAVATRWSTVGPFRIHERLTVPFGADPLPLLCVHGLSVSERHFRPLVDLLAREHDVFAPDLPGFGSSARPARPLAVAQFARFLADWLDVAGLPRAVVIANSMGCQASVDLAVAKPDRVAGLVLVGPTVDPRARSLRSQTARLVLDSLREPLRLDAVVLSDYARVGPRRTLRSARVMLAHRLEERLPLLRVPTLVVRGERDPIVPKEWAEEAAGLVPDGRLVVVPGAAHCAHFTHPEAVARAIADFLASPGQV